MQSGVTSRNGQLQENLTCYFLKAERDSVTANLYFCSLHRQMLGFPAGLGWGHYTPILAQYLCLPTLSTRKRDWVHLRWSNFTSARCLNITVTHTDDPREDPTQKYNFPITGVQTEMLGKEVSCFDTYSKCGKIRGRISGKCIQPFLFVLTTWPHFFL